MGGSLQAAEIARQLAVAKAEAVAARHPDRIVVGADQVLARDGETFCKPGNAEAACRQIARLAGRTHMLHSGVAVVAGDQLVSTFVADARLTMRALDDAAIARYVACAGDAALRSVGGYEIEGFGIHLFDHVEGEHSTILGLPLVPLLAVLRDLDLLAI